MPRVGPSPPAARSSCCTSSTLPISSSGSASSRSCATKRTRPLESHAAKVREKIGIEPELTVREGNPIEEIHKLIEEDQDIAILVLAAGSGKEGPGPLVSAIAGRNAAFPIPVTVVPQNLSDEDVESLA